MKFRLGQGRVAPYNLILKDNLIFYLLRPPTSPDPDNGHMYQIVISYCYCERGSVICLVTRGLLSLLSYLCTNIHTFPLVSKVFGYSDPSSFLLCSAGCVHMYYPLCSSAHQALTTLRSQLVQNSLGNKISLYALLRLRKL